MERFDLVVLGAGSAARDGARKAAREFGSSVAFVESTRWGGSCPNVACEPTRQGRTTSTRRGAKA